MVPALARASHPEPVAVVTALVLAAGVRAGIEPGRLALLGAAVLSGQLYVGWQNDLIDRGRDRAAGRLEKPLVAGAIDAHTLALAGAIALVAAAGLSLAVGVVPGLLHLLAVGVASSYNLGLKATWLSPVCYVVAFALLAAVVTLAAPHPAPPRAGIVVTVALLAAGNHFCQVLPDIEADRRLGVGGLPQALGPGVVGLVGPGLLAAAAVTFAATSGRQQAWLWIVPALLLAVAALAGHRFRRPRTGFRAAMLSAAAVLAAVAGSGAPLA